MLNDIVDKYNNTYHKVIKIIPTDIIDSHAEYNVDSNAKEPKFKISSHHIRISKYRNIFAKGYAPNRPK